jgi:RNA polymerase sigma-70 factor, ECF subfamily
MILPSLSVQDSQLTDEAIVPRIRGGETELFEILMRRHNPKVYRAVRSILRDEADVEDAMQQAYLSAFAHLGQFEGASRVSTWLVRIAINEAIGRRHSELRLVAPGQDPSEDKPLQPDPKENPEERTAAREVGQWLERAIEALPEHYRTAVMLRDVEGLNTQEVAEALGVSEEVVKTRLHRARALLRDQIEADLFARAGEAFAFHAPRCDRVVAGVMQVLRTS